MSDLNLNLPVIKEGAMPPPIVSMDEYIEFFKLFQKYFFNQEAYNAWIKISAVNVKFVL
ncbi:MAG: hypothetical protein HYS07_10925 [Chlamydiae bacterium]|nr:hypothetical protein [Chlamydiota bacterium]MBI3276571.1 hypothetical protein [Chlamydiota bacterium]